MTIKELESNVLSRIAFEMRNAKSIDTVNKLYRHARIWARIHIHYGDSCSKVDAETLYAKIKAYRKVNIIRLGGIVNE